MPIKLTNHECFTIAVLFYINIINYMDRYNVAAILRNLQDDFGFTDEYAGLLQTAFLLAYTIFAPIFGFLGDRYSRRIILAISVFIWSAGTLCGSFTNSYWLFFFMRTFVGIGEASFSTIAPTVIYDVTYKDIRKTVLGIFYTAIPIGVGLGIVTAASMARVTGHWCWGLRVTPLLNSFGIILLGFIKDPVRGERERLETGKDLVARKSTYCKDLGNILRNRSYVLSTLGFTCVTFMIGGLSWWGPSFFHSGFRLIPGKEDLQLADVIAGMAPAGVLSGLIGVPLGSFMSNKLTKRYPASDPIICGASMLVGDPFLITGFYFTNESIPITYVVTVTGVILMNLSWTIVADILLSCVLPESRSSAEAFQLVFIHAFGDAGSPYAVGVLSEFFKDRWKPKGFYPDKLKRIHQFEALRNGLLCISFMQIIGGALFFLNARYIVDDRNAVIAAIASSVRPSLET